MPTLSDKILKGLQLNESVLQSYNTSNEGVTTKPLGESNMNDSNVATLNANPSKDEVIDQLEKLLNEKEDALSGVADELAKVKKAKNAAQKAKREAEAKIEDLKAEIVGLKEDATVEVDTSGAQTKIDMALFRLDTIMQLSQGQNMISMEHLRLVIKDLAGEEKTAQLLALN